MVDRPIALNPFALPNRSYIPFEFTPLYSGLPFSQNVTFTSSNGTTQTVSLGGLVEAFAFGGNKPSQGIGDGSISSVASSASGLLSLPKPATVPGSGLARAVGVSSMAPAALFSQALGSDLTLTTEELWQASGDFSGNEMLVGDGGNVDNDGIFSMLRRRVSSLVVFVNCEQALNTSWVPSERPPTETDIDGYIPALFGIEVYGNETGEYLGNNQIFPTEDFSPLAEALIAADGRGKGILVNVTLTTIENQFMGIAAGITVDIVWYYLGMPSLWYNQLPLSVRTNLGLGILGDYYQFPHYSTLEQLKLSASQVNLLANMLTWTVRENQELLEAALSTEEAVHAQER